MALSKSVNDSLEDAEASLRNALAYAARQEKPFICSGIAELMGKIESMKTMDSLFDKLESRQEGDSGTWGPLID
jgi:hypothetical protein